MPRLLSSIKNNFSKKDLLLLTKKYSCPFWVYDANIIEMKIKQLHQFDIIRFAQKACSNIHILKLMKNFKVKIDAVSLGEIERALYAGFNPKYDIVFTSDIFEQETLKKIVELKIPTNIGSLSMLDQLGKISPKHKIWLRINPGFGHGHNKKTNTGGKNSKHGIWYKDLLSASFLIKKYKLKLIGLHMHIGSGVNYYHLKKVCNAMLKNVKYLNEDINFISAGGGLSIPYTEDEKEIKIKDYYAIWDKARFCIEKHFGHKIQLEIEPGRFLVAESGILISQICAIKSTQNRNFVLINAGFNDLMRPVLYGSYHYISILTFDERKINFKKQKKTIIAGPLCESGDVFTQSKDSELMPRLFPIDIKIGDYLIFHETGAYGASMSSNYNTRPLIPEVLFRNGIPKEIRRRQTFEEILALEKI